MVNLDKRVLTYNEFVELQDELNSFIFRDTDLEWNEVLTEDHFITQVVAELKELIDSGVVYKWWKKSDGVVDHHNVKVEIIDILHFVFSIMALKIFQDKNRVMDFDISPDLRSIIHPLVKLDNSLDYSVFCDILRSVVSVDDVVDENMAEHYVEAVSKIIGHGGLNGEEASVLYISKYYLNKIRQMEGYKTGEYVKVVDGVEDNERLEKIVNCFDVNPGMVLADIEQMVFEEFFQSA